jgi:hypothetical protein
LQWLPPRRVSQVSVGSRAMRQETLRIEASLRMNG